MKEELLKKQLSVMKDEEGRIVDVAGLDYVTVEDLMKAIGEADFWDDIPVKAYEDLCEVCGLDYHSYDDPDKMMQDVEEALDA